MKYFFLLGTNKALSLAELFSVLPETQNGSIINGSIFVVDLEKEIDASDLISKVGGIIKIGKLVDDTMPLYSAQMTKEIEAMVKPKDEGKYKFGISNYAKFSSPQKNKRLAMELKKYLKTKETSCRWVTGKEMVLSSVIVEQNLMRNGIEIIILGDYKKAYVGETLAVQPFKDLSYRDYGRPGRDDHSGMLPPKLAQILINLSGAKKEDTLWDPFCGSGTVVTEAMLIGIENIIGSDISEKALDDTKQNVSWFKRKFECEMNPKIYNLDAMDVKKKIKDGTIDCVATEPYLGPQRGQVDSVKLQTELNQLYSKFIRSIYSAMKTGGTVAMVWPVRFVGEKQTFLSPDLAGFKKQDPLNDNFKRLCKVNFSHRGNILYGRDGQKVWREIVLLEKE